MSTVLGSWDAAALMAQRWTRPIVWLARFERILAVAEATSLRTLGLAPAVYEWTAAAFREGRIALPLSDRPADFSGVRGDVSRHLR